MESHVPGDETRSTPIIDVDAVVEFTRQLVRIPSVYDPARGLNEQPAAELVAEQMRAFGWSPRVDLVADGRPNVIADDRRRPPGPDAAVRGAHRRRHRRRRAGMDRRSVRRRAARRADLRPRLGGHEIRRRGDAVRCRCRDPRRLVPGTARRRRPRRRGGDDGGRARLRGPRARRRHRRGDLLRARGRRDLHTPPRERCACASTSPARWPMARCPSRAATRTAPSPP